MFDQVHPDPPWRRGDDRQFRPPRPVWVNLARVYPRPEHIRPYPSGWDVQAEVPGTQSAWIRTAAGGWLAAVTFTIRRGDGNGGGVPQTAWVPAEAIRLRHDAPARKDQRKRPTSEP
ncbi:hypothetical protein [Saccharopolyspora shandongensis]|uniref:hypothetical protein n=1 Tax=Saccharopolyspora shandongensis TaxID=418495 RepID=UPI0033E5DD9E